MARAIVHCATEGCDGYFYADGCNRRDAHYRATKLTERGWTCRDCDNREAAEAAVAAGLPQLEGSAKQVAWANKIRNATVSQTEQWIQIAASIPDAADLSKSGYYREAVGMALLIRREGRPAVDEAFAAMRSETDARYWIDGRDEAPHDQLAAVIVRLAKEEHALSPEGKAEAAAMQDAMSEATLRPSVPVSETIAELSFRDGRYVVRYDEFAEAFRDVVKGRLGYQWDAEAKVWARTHAPATMGDPVDRLAETAHELLAAGIVVAVHDPAARAKAVDRSYEPEHRRWVSLVTQGVSKGKFKISWGRDEDLYRQFRGIRGATYKGKSCLVPATSRDEVLDFAEAHGFRLTPAAQARAAEVLAERERGIVVNAKAAPKAEIEQRGDRPGCLDIPSDVVLHDDLVD